MWKASAGHKLIDTQNEENDDWETDPDFINDVTEQEQRWGSKTVEGSGRTAGTINMQQLREETEKSDANKKKKEIEEFNPGFGYGGKFGLETDRMDKSAVGHDYIGKVEKHASQKDYSDGFGGKFGVQSDRFDKSAAGWDHKETVVKHGSQKDYSTGFGGKYGVQNDRVDKSALGWDHIEKVEKHESQKDYSKGFGGKFGVQEDRKDKSALGWDHVEATQKHESQVDHKVGFGGKFGIQSDRMDKSAVGFQENPDKIGTNYTKVKPDIGSAKPSNLRAKFENLAKSSEEEDLKRTIEQKKLREEKDRRDRDEAAKRQLYESNEAEAKPIQRKTAIDTQRSGTIAGAISAFNQQATTPTTTPTTERENVRQRRESLEAIKVQRSNNISSVTQPDVIPTQEIETIERNSVLSKANEFNAAVETYSIVNKQKDTKTIENENIRPTISQQQQQQQQQDQQQQQHESVPIAEMSRISVTEDIETNTKQQPQEQPAAAAAAAVAVDESQLIQQQQQNNELIYQNLDDLSEYIEDTGVKATALYDYQAAAEDEISFDPDDLITHIEQIDEGWWRGLCKNKYGLFPANYVQLQQ